MSKEELVDRLLVAQADIDAWRLKTGKLSDDDFSKLSEAMGQLAEAPLFIDDTPGLNIMEMRTKARRLQMEHGVKLLIVDYLQLIDGGKKLKVGYRKFPMFRKSEKYRAGATRARYCRFSALPGCGSKRHQSAATGRSA